MFDDFEFNLYVKNRRVQNWGSKWDLNPETLIIDRQSPFHINFIFETANSPPLPIYSDLAKQHFSIQAYFSDISKPPRAEVIADPTQELLF